MTVQIGDAVFELIDAVNDLSSLVPAHLEEERFELKERIGDLLAEMVGES